MSATRAVPALAVWRWVVASLRTARSPEHASAAFSAQHWTSVERRGVLEKALQ